ncbi:PIG-L family deacetylase [Kineosporia mesophila]|uniref:PIG-L family deacetylase n=1 Tax=Kineosporia mesophila TaxID=566012 RepID=A0ABP6ZMM6_9ACTN|nr:PIG-L family deacetylase [Kineosporia mesophila]MCD5353651.1 PIG-L family deacetylase [Kineosporia mesophila]
MRTRTLVSFHAHPDDEALLTGGTLARVAAMGHRVVLAFATDGEAGLASTAASGSDLRQTRVKELERAAGALGCARVVRFALPDSGWIPGHVPDEGTFSRLPVEDASAALTQVLEEEQADALTIYDPAGGYGHPDHQQVHRAGMHAAFLAGTPCVLEATLPRQPLLRFVRLARWVPGLLDSVEAQRFETAFTPREEITHQVDVRPYLKAKRRALQAHASQASSDSGPRTLRLLLSLPTPVFQRVAGKEYFVERTPPSSITHDLLGTTA